jgi:hypothetical protein
MQPSPAHPAPTDALLDAYASAVARTPPGDPAELGDAPAQEA